MKTREVVVVRHDSRLYGVRARSRTWFGCWNGWKDIIDQGRTWAWSYKTARLIADQVLANGFIPGQYRSEALAVMELDEEHND